MAQRRRLTIEDIENVLRKEPRRLPQTLATPPEEFISPYFPEGRRGCLNGKHFHISGHFNNFSKDQVYEQIEFYGGIPVRRYRQNSLLNYLVYGTLPYQPAIDRAKENHVKVISYRQFVNMIEDS